MAPDVLDHDDRVIHDPADRDCDGPECQDVQRVPERLQPDECDEHARRDRDRGHERRTHREQEEQDDEHREQQAESTFNGESLDRLLDVGGLVEDNGEGDSVQLLLEVGQDVEHAVRDIDGVGCRELRDRDRHRRLAVHARDRRDGVLALLDGGDVGDRDRSGLELLGIRGNER